MRSHEVLGVIGCIGRIELVLRAAVMSGLLAGGIAVAQAQSAAPARTEQTPPVATPSASAAASASVSASAPTLTVSRQRAWTSAIAASSVMAAAGEVGVDPLLPGIGKTRELQFKKHDEDVKKPTEKVNPGWWREFFLNLSSGLRIAMWLLVAAGFIWVLLRLRDWVRLRDREALPKAQAPTHVGSLDIRPESLPDDIGAAARALWQRGETRPALSLLYRGALSRLVHGHGVPIRAASTESDCLALAATRLRPESQDFLTLLIQGWQSVAYARRELPAEDFEWLCAGFDARMAAERRP